MAPEYKLYVHPEISDRFEKTIAQIEGIEIKEITRSELYESLGVKANAVIASLSNSLLIKELLNSISNNLHSPFQSLEGWSDFTGNLTGKEKGEISRILSILNYRNRPTANMTIEEAKRCQWDNLRGIGPSRRLFLQLAFQDSPRSS